MKKIIVLITCICILFGCSKYRMVHLDEPIRDSITSHINAYLIRPTISSSNEFKEIYKIDKNVDINMQDFRVLYVDWDNYARSNPNYTRGMIYVIDHFEHPYKQDNQIYPKNPWEEYLKQYTDKFIRGFNKYVSKEEGIMFDMLEGYNYNLIDITCFGGHAFYFKDAKEEEIINYISQIPLAICLDGEYSNHLLFGTCQHTYLINDVNLYVEDINGDIIKISK